MSFCLFEALLSKRPFTSLDFPRVPVSDTMWREDEALVNTEGASSRPHCKTLTISSCVPVHLTPTEKKPLFLNLLRIRPDFSILNLT